MIYDFLTDAHKLDQIPSTLWVALTIDYTTDIMSPSSTLKSLVELCAEKMISDVYMLETISGYVPGKIQSIMLQAALAKNRVLSIIHLLKTYPSEELVLPLPDCLKNWSLLHKPTMVLTNELKTVQSNAETIVSTFFNIIAGNSTLSNLHIVDLNEIPLENSLLRRIDTFLKVSSNHLPDTKYTLKVGFIMSNGSDIETLYQVKHKKYKNFKLIVTGIQIFNGNFDEQKLKKVMDQLDSAELQYFSLEFCDVRCLYVIKHLLRFKNLTALNLTYILDMTMEASLLDIFSKTLNELPHLSRLSLRGCKLTGCLNVLLLNNCKRDTSKRPRTDFYYNCCLAHSGKLQYLDLSSCELETTDLQCLMEYPLTNTIKYLSLAYNNFQSEKLAKCLELMKSSVVMLDLELCIPETSSLDPLFSVLHKMEKIKSLILKDLHIEEQDLPVLAIAFRKMLSLKHVCLSKPVDISDATCDEFKQTLMLEKRINITWGNRRFRLQ